MTSVDYSVIRGVGYYIDKQVGSSVMNKAGFSVMNIVDYSIIIREGMMLAYFDFFLSVFKGGLPVLFFAILDSDLLIRDLLGTDILVTSYSLSD